MSAFYSPLPVKAAGWRQKCFEIIFGYKTAAGRFFDVALVVIILLSVAIVLADSVSAINQFYGHYFKTLEWLFTLAFTAEYLLRLYVVRHPVNYAKSFYGVVDLLSILPTYLSLLFPGMQFLVVLRVLRILRIFEILEMRRYNRASSILLSTLLSSWRKILVFLLAMLTLITIFGALLFVIEGPEYGFTSIPTAMYWALISVTTVGYGDISPVTPFGRLVASFLILIGYGIIAVPTGIYSAELINQMKITHNNIRCLQCGLTGHESDAKFCRQCATDLPTETGLDNSKNIGAEPQNKTEDG